MLLDACGLTEGLKKENGEILLASETNHRNIRRISGEEIRERSSLWQYMRKRRQAICGEGEKCFVRNGVSLNRYRKWLVEGQ